jgi:hypothetical protein
MAHDERIMAKKCNAALRKRGNTLLTVCYLPIQKIRGGWTSRPFPKTYYTLFYDDLEMDPSVGFHAL